jgi:cytoskeletal protein CcmA (bactofilin family)
MSARDALRSTADSTEHAPGHLPAAVERRVIAWVGKSVVFTGHLASSEDMTVDGRIEGTVEVLQHSLTIGPDADIRANITALNGVVLGKVSGSITATGKVDIRESGSVDGDISAPRLIVADGAVLHARVQKGISQPAGAQT